MDLTQAEIERLSGVSESELFAELGAAYLVANQAWIGTPTGPHREDLGSTEAVGRRLWRNFKPKLSELLCGKGNVATAFQSMQGPTISAVVEYLAPLLVVSLLTAPVTAKIMAIIVGRTLAAVGREKLCEFLAEPD